VGEERLAPCADLLEGGVGGKGRLGAAGGVHGVDVDLDVGPSAGEGGTYLIGPDPSLVRGLLCLIRRAERREADGNK